MSLTNKIAEFLVQIRKKITSNDYDNIIEKLDNFRAVGSKEDDNIIVDLMNDLFEIADKFTDNEFKYLLESVAKLRVPLYIDDTKISTHNRNGYFN